MNTPNHEAHKTCNCASELHRSAVKEHTHTHVANGSGAPGTLVVCVCVCALLLVSQNLIKEEGGSLDGGGNGGEVAVLGAGKGALD